MKKLQTLEDFLNNLIASEPENLDVEELRRQRDFVREYCRLNNAEAFVIPAKKAEGGERHQGMGQGE